LLLLWSTVTQGRDPAIADIQELAVEIIRLVVFGLRYSNFLIAIPIACIIVWAPLK
jgi:hypothetical protein